MELYLAPEASFALCPALHTTTIDSSAVSVLCSMPPAPPAPASCRPPPPLASAVFPLISPGFIYCPVPPSPSARHKSPWDVLIPSPPV